MSASARRSMGADYMRYFFTIKNIRSISIPSPQEKLAIKPQADAAFNSIKSFENYTFAEFQNIDNLVHIVFEKPLSSQVPQLFVSIVKAIGVEPLPPPPIQEIYFSVERPSEFIDYVQRLQRG